MDDYYQFDEEAYCLVGEKDRTHISSWSESNGKSITGGSVHEEY